MKNYSLIITNYKKPFDKERRGELKQKVTTGVRSSGRKMFVSVVTVVVTTLSLFFVLPLLSLVVGDGPCVIKDTTGRNSFGTGLR